MPTILVIEDDSAVRDFVLDTLKEGGFQAQGAENGFIGLDWARANLPDLIVCDVMMPHLDGYGVLQALREESITATIPFVFLTANKLRDHVRQGMERGADDYISKPFKPEELVAAVHTQLAKKELIARQYEAVMDDLRENILFALPHELRTPLASILGYAELLIMDADNLRPGQTADMSQAIHRSGKRLSRLVENYLVYAQIELISTNPEQMMALREHRVNARVVIAEVVQELVADAGRDDDLHLSLCDGTLGMADESLRKIVGELVENALKFSGPGSPLFVESEMENGLFQLCIGDEGRGMTAKQIRDVGAYMQFDRALFEQQGLGLGLIISKRLVELHGGTCDIESAVDQGTLLTIRLPL